MNLHGIRFLQIKFKLEDLELGSLDCCGTSPTEGPWRVKALDQVSELRSMIAPEGGGWSAAAKPQAAGDLESGNGHSRGAENGDWQ